MNEQRLIWLDLEMSGLDPHTDKLLEVAIIITDWRLQIIAEAKPWAIYQPAEIFAQMDDWNKKTHQATGLIERCSQSKQDESAVQSEVLAFLNEHVKKQSSPMCGNSICQDRRFLYEYMRGVESFFHYRNYDVSSFKIAFAHHHPQVLEKVKKQSTHSALDDIRESIDEMKLYLSELKLLG